MKFQPGLKAVDLGCTSEIVQDDQVSMILDEFNLDSEKRDGSRIIQRTGWIHFTTEADPAGTFSTFNLGLEGHLTLAGKIRATLLVGINGDPYLVTLPGGVDGDDEPVDGLVVNPPNDPHKIQTVITGSIQTDSKQILLSLTLMLAFVEPHVDDHAMLAVDTLALNISAQESAA